MKAIHVALLWAASFIVYGVVLVSLYALVPQGMLFQWYSALFGSIRGGDWDRLVGDLFIYGSAIITFCLVWIIAWVALRKYRGI